MIPLHLTLRNFMSYGEGHPTLNLEGVHVACLSGPNGHGKSTLLDAMVWALWGEVRGGSRAGDDLIRHGASEMMVEFELEAGGQRYRTLRRRTRRNRTGVTELHFESWDGDMWRSLDGGSATETQRVISDTLHMTHHTFVHASFIGQGQADAFMTLEPRTRKQVLGEILDLGQYELLAKLANEEKRLADQRAALLEAQVRSIEAELGKREEYAKRLLEAEKAEAEASELAERLTAERLALRSEAQRLEQIARQAQERAVELQRTQDRIRTLEGQSRELQQRVAEAQALAEQAEAIERDFAAYQRLDEEDRSLGQRFEPWRQATDDARTAESAIERERTRLATQLEAARLEVTRLERRQAARPELEARADAIRTQTAALGEHAEAVLTLRTQLDEATNGLAELKQIGERLKNDLDARQSRRQLLGEHDTCPVCGQQLGAAGLISVQDQLDHECAEITGQLDQTRRDYAQRANTRKGVEEQIKKLEVILRDRPTLERSLGEITVQMGQADEDAQALVAARQEAAAFEQTLHDNDFAPEARAQLANGSLLIAAIGYDPTRHQQVRAERERLRQAPHHRQLLEGARATLETQALLRDGLLAQIREAEGMVVTMQAETNALNVEAAQLPQVRQALQVAEAHLQQAATLQQAASRDLGQARQHINWLASQEKERDSKAAERKDALVDMSAYSQLAEAFGRNGIQEMIIEQAIPEIEDAANDLLGRLTDGRMRVMISTQREGRSGVTSTLDVNVSDELGTRPYELFSGGEKFRINFAIRIALSRLLARRAGVPLQTLAIDEGFGSQDRQGCDRLIEAIRSIQDDFARVLVITHLDEMKDAFPVLIEVSKTPSGSTFSIA